MGTSAPFRVVLMSIHPEYAQAILDGTKRVEFRKRALAPSVTHVVIYSTAPVQRVVGWFKIGAQHVNAPEELWNRFRDCGGVGYRDYSRYFRGKDKAVAIEVESVQRFAAPLSLQRDLGVEHPPQSFQYLNPRRLEVGSSLRRPAPD